MRDAPCAMTNQIGIEGATKMQFTIFQKKSMKKRRQQICPFRWMMHILTAADGFHTFIVWTMAHLHSMTNLIPSIFWLKITYFAVRFHLHLHQKSNVHRMTHCAIYLLSCWEMRNYTNRHIKRKIKKKKNKYKKIWRKE